MFALTTSDVRLLVDALQVAGDDLRYRVSELDDTGDYEPEDIEEMARRVERFNELESKLAAVLEVA